MGVRFHLSDSQALGVKCVEVAGEEGEKGVPKFDATSVRMAIVGLLKECGAE